MTKKVEVKVAEVSEIQSFIARDITILRSEVEGMDKDTFGDFAFGKGLKLKEIEKAWSELGAKTTRSGVYENVLRFLQEAPRTQVELADFITGPNSSINEIRWFNARDNIRVTTIAIFKKYIPEGDFTEQLISSVRREELAQLVKDHDEAKKTAKAKAAKLASK
jgi:hypothetical protein